MVQVTNTSMVQDKLNVVRLRGEKVKVPAKNSDKVASSSSSNVLESAGLPGRFKVQPRAPSLLLAQAGRAGRSGKSTTCVPGLTTPRRRTGGISGLKLGRWKLTYRLKLARGSVYAIRSDGLVTKLDAKIVWDANRRKPFINGRVLKSTYGDRAFHAELNKLVAPQLNVMLHESNNNAREGWIPPLNKEVGRIAGKLSTLRRSLGRRRFKKDVTAKKHRAGLMKFYRLLKSHQAMLKKQSDGIKSLKRRKGRFTASFLKQLTTLETQNNKLKGQIRALKKKLWGVIDKYWFRDARVRKRPC